MHNIIIVLWPIGLLVAFAIILDIWFRYETRRSERLKQEAANIAYRMTLLHQEEIDAVRQEGYYTTLDEDCAEYCMLCLQENPDLTLKEMLVMYLQEDFLGERNSGQLE